jgi:pimeloyl-ACP methyl ester carboxylesterase
MTEEITSKNRLDTPRNIKLPRLLEAIWRDRRIGWALAIGAAVLFGLLVAMTMPRGPATTAQALIAMFAGLAVGLIAGMATRSRWAMLLAPIAHMIVIEIAWLGVPGPTVDGIRLDETFGIIALFVGRGFYALVVLLPIVLGASLGAWYARKISGQVSGKPGSLNTIARWTPTVILSILLLVLAVEIALPASTPPIPGEDGKPLPGSIAELTTVKIGGHDQELLIRGYNTSNPVFLYLSGGPGQSDLAYPRALFADLEKNFTVVSWDKRGTGYSYPGLDPASTLTFDSAVSDTIEVTNYLRERFHQDKIYLFGESYGTVLGVKTVQERPDLYYAYIGSGQMVSPKETDQRLWQDVIDYANRTGDTGLASRMIAYGKPPYKDIYAYTTVMNYYDALASDYASPEDYREKITSSGVNPLGVMASEYSLVEKINVMRGLFDMFSVMYPQLQEIDFRKDTTKLDVPVYIIDADHELSARRDLALEWYGMLDAPQKHIYTMKNAGHSAAFEGVGEFTRIMNEEVLPQTYPGR